MAPENKVSQVTVTVHTGFLFLNFLWPYAVCMVDTSIASNVHYSVYLKHYIFKG